MKRSCSHRNPGTGKECMRTARDGSDTCTRHAPGYVAPKRAARVMPAEQAAEIDARLAAETLPERPAYGGPERSVYEWAVHHTTCAMDLEQTALDDSQEPSEREWAESRMRDHYARAVAAALVWLLDDSTASAVSLAPQPAGPDAEPVEAVDLSGVRAWERGWSEYASPELREAEANCAPRVADCEPRGRAQHHMACAAMFDDGTMAKGLAPAVVIAKRDGHIMRAVVALLEWASEPDKGGVAVAALENSGAASAVPDPVYDDGRVALYAGDCLALLGAIVKRHGRPHHVITDPPYSERTMLGARSLSKKRGGKGPSAGRADHSAGELGGTLVPFMASEELVRLALQACLASRWTIAFCDIVHAGALFASPVVGTRAVRVGAWVKPDGAPQLTGDRPAQGWEAISIAHADAAEMRWNAGGKRGVWTHYVERDVPWHPTPKPVPLLREMIRDFTDPDDLIVDPFGGSGSTAVACRMEGRRCVAIELREDFASLAAQRLREGRARPTNADIPGDLFARVG